jgi:hypothetical protein
MVDSFQKRDRDRRKRQERNEKQARRKERSALKRQGLGGTAPSPGAPDLLAPPVPSHPDAVPARDALVPARVDLAIQSTPRSTTT